MLRLKKMAVLVASLLALSGCATTSNKEAGEQIGALVGLALGVALGDSVGDEASKFVGGAVGMVAGKMIGGEIGKRLDEVDRLKAELATKAALAETGNATVSWKSDKNVGVGGTVSTVANGNCKIVSQVVNINGEETRQESKMCKQLDGGWKLG